MVNFETSTPESDPELVRVQWYHDAGVGNGVDPKVAEEIGYTNYETLSPQPSAQTETIAETPIQKPSKRTTNHINRHPRSPAQHPRVRQSPAYDKVITPEMRLQPFPPIDPEAAQRARQIVDGSTNDVPDQT